MRYLKTYEDIQLKLWDDLPVKYKDIIVFHNNDWLVFKPNTYEQLYDLSKDTEWGISNIYSNYHSINNFKPTQYQMNDYIYVNINIRNNDKFLFDFYKSDFIDKDENDIVLKDFFDLNKELFNFYGESIKCENVIKDGNEYWIVVDDNVWFFDFYNVDIKISEKFLKSVLEGDALSYFEQEEVELDEYGVKLDNNSIILIQCILLAQNISLDDVIDINDYDDVVDLIEEYDIDELKKLLIRCISDGKQAAEEHEAYESITNAFYDFFGLKVGSAKWQYYNNSKYQKLFIKFKSKESAYYAKFRINNYDDSYSDDKIDYSPPYYGYSGDDKIMNINLNQYIFDLYSEYFNKEDVSVYYNLWKELLSNNVNKNDIIKEIKFLLDTKKYNL